MLFYDEVVSFTFECFLEQSDLILLTSSGESIDTGLHLYANSPEMTETSWPCDPQVLIT